MRLAKRKKPCYWLLDSIFQSVLSQKLDRLTNCVPMMSPNPPVVISLKKSVVAQSSVATTLQKIPTQDVIGYPVCSLPFQMLVVRILQWAEASSSKVVCVANVHMLMEAHWNDDFSQILKQADLLTPDGMPLVWMVSLLQKRRQERVAGMDLLLGICEGAKTQSVSLFFLGSDTRTLDQIKARLDRDFPHVTVVGMSEMPRIEDMTAEEEEAVIQQVNAANPGIVFVCLGCPKQEKWMHKNKHSVNAVMVGLGGAFSVFAGNTKWAPKFVRDSGLEWLYRCIQEPGRLWKRYASTIPPFIFLALKQVVSKPKN